MDKYCSPIKTFTPIAVAAVDITIERTLVSLSWIVVKILGTIPVTNNSPPKASANKTSEMVNSILFMPPLVSNSSTGEKPVWASKPLNQIFQMSAQLMP
jgi:hypothetical protein